MDASTFKFQTTRGSHDFCADASACGYEKVVSPMLFSTLYCESTTEQRRVSSDGSKSELEQYQHSQVWTTSAQPAPQETWISVLHYDKGESILSNMIPGGEPYMQPIYNVIRTHTADQKMMFKECATPTFSPGEIAGQLTSDTQAILICDENQSKPISDLPEHVKKGQNPVARYRTYPHASAKLLFNDTALYYTTDKYYYFVCVTRENKLGVKRVPVSQYNNDTYLNHLVFTFKPLESLSWWGDGSNLVN